MPRNVKGSDDEWELRGPRKTRMTLNSSVHDSPLRRSTRNRQPTNQDNSSPESTSDVSTGGVTRTTRRRTLAMDTAISEPTRQPRNRRNSGTSDISEVAETESLAESTTKRITRRSIAAMPSSGTPTKGRGRTPLRAESESKSTPPVARVTRRTRASSMEPEISNPIITDVEISAKSRKRASVLPSEPVLVEEPEEVKTVDSLHSSEQIVYEVDEDEAETTNNTSKLSRRKSKGEVGEADEKMDVEESSVESGIDIIARSIQENSESPTDNSNSSMNRDGLTKIADSSPRRDNEIGDTSLENRSVSSPNKSSSYSIDNIVNKSTEMQEKSPGNKENEIFNKNIVLGERHVVANADVRFSHRKSLNSEFAINSEKRSSVNETLSDNYHSKGVVKNQEIVTKDSLKDSPGAVLRKEYMIDADCVVVLETMREGVRNTVEGVRTSNASETLENEKKSKVCSENSENEDLENAKVKDNENIKDLNTFTITNVVSISNEVEEIKEEDDEVQIIPNVNEPKTTFHLDGENFGTTTTLSGTSSKNVAEDIPMETFHDDTNIAREIITSGETIRASLGKKSPTKRSSLSPELIIRRLSVDWVTKSQELEEDEAVFVCEMVKDRKSSIVTESPMNGTNVVEASKIVEEDDTDKRLSKGSLQKANKDRKHSEKDIVDEMLSKKDDELRVTDSENESDSIICPSFKDIPADEWVGAGDNGGSKTNEDEDKNSVHSFSTEQNDSEYELVLDDKESCQTTEKANADKVQENINYDSDATVIEGSGGTATKKDEGSNEKLETNIQSEEIMMDVSNDIEDDEESNVSKPSTSKRSSLNTSKKLRNKNSPRKIEDSGNDSPINSNVSKRESLMSTDEGLTMDGESRDNSSNVEANVSSKFNKSLKTRNSIENQGNNDSSDDDVDTTEAKTPKTSNNVSRKSLVESASKSKHASPATSKLISLGTPMNKKAKDTPEKRRSMNKSLSRDDSKVLGENDPDIGLAQTYVDEAGNIEIVTGESPARGERKESRSKNTTINDSPDTNRNDSFEKLIIDEDQSNTSVSLEYQDEKLTKSTNLGSPRKSISKRKSLVNAHENSESETDPQLNRNDVKTESPRKSLSNKNISRIEQVNSESEVEDDAPSQINRSIKSDSARKSLNNSNNSRISLGSSLSGIDLDGSLTTEQSPRQKLNKSAKSESAQKSISNKNNPKISESESDINENDSQRNLNKSGKSSSSRKSLNSQNNSKIMTVKFDSDMDDGDSQENSISPEMSEKKLNISAKRGSARKSLNKSGSKIAQASSDSGDEDDFRANLNKSTTSSTTKTRTIDPNYSIMGQVNSDSEAEEDVESNSSENEADASTKLPRFLFDVNSTASSDDDSDDKSVRSVDSDIAREMNLDGKSIIKYSDDDVPGDDCMVTESESPDSDDDGSDLNDFVVGDDEEVEEEEDEEEEESCDEAELDLNSDDDEPSSAVDIKQAKTRKRIIPRPARDSDSSDTDVEIAQPSPVKSDESKDIRTPKKEKDLNDSKNIVELPVKSVDLNESSKSSAKKKKKMHEDLLIQCSTPKLPVSECLFSEKSNSSKKKKSAAIEIASAKKSPKPAVAEVVETPSKHGSSFKEVKTPKNFDPDQQQLRTSLPTDLNVSGKGTKSPKSKSINVPSLHHTMTTPNSDSPEIRFLMKEKLNDTLPALKLQQKMKSSRRSMLDNVREDAEPKDKGTALIGENIESTTDGHVSIRDEADPSAMEVSNTEKKKKKKKKKNQSNVSVEADKNVVEELKDNEEIEIMAVDSKECSVVDKLTKESKKRKRNKKPVEEETEMQIVTESVEIPKKTNKYKKNKTLEEGNVEDVEPGRATKKNKKKHALEEENVEDVETKQTSKKDKKKKKQKIVQVEESEVSTSRKNISRDSENGDDSGDAPIAVGFDQARTVAFEEMKKITESIKAGQITKRQKQVASRANLRGVKDTGNNNEKSKTSIKRLPDDVLESLADVAERPNKRRKVTKEKVFVPSRTMFHSDRQPTTSINVSEDFIPLSTSGGTTKFGVVNLKKVAQKSKKSAVVETFRERMLARNPRQPVSAYLMYQQKQKSSGKDRLY